MRNHEFPFVRLIEHCEGKGETSRLGRMMGDIAWLDWYPSAFHVDSKDVALCIGRDK